MKTSVAEFFIPREPATRLRGLSPNSGSKPASEPQRALPVCAGRPGRGFVPFGGLACRAFLLASMLQPLHLALAATPCAPCPPFITKFECGMSVATCYSGFPVPGNPSCMFGATVDPSGFVVVMIDTRNPALNAPGPGVNWPAPMFHNECPVTANTWNAAHLGQVFGITLDGGSPPNIYVAATSFYVGDSFVPGVGPGGVFKLDGTTFAISLFSVIPSVGSVSLGDICYDMVNNQFFVSELDNGKIWCLNAGGTPQPPAYDHGTTGRLSASPPVLPSIPDTSLLTGDLTGSGRRVFGLQVSQGRLYYAVNFDTSNEVWSVGVVSGGVTLVSPNGPKLEIVGAVLPTPTPPPRITPITDIAFSQSGKMLLSERGLCLDDPTNLRTLAHSARVLEFMSIAGGWTQTLPGYEIGKNAAGTTNSAGGNDYDCKGCIYATTDLPTNLVYGLQILCPPCTNTACSFLIDLDCDTSSTTAGQKTQIGDVEVYRCCGFQNNDYCTRTQGGWGAEPNGSNAGTILAANFNTVYPNGFVEVGIPGFGGKSMTFTSATAIRDYLPQGGKPGVLITDFVNPTSNTSTGAGVFGGQVLALQLNVDFSAANIPPTPQGPLGDLTLCGFADAKDGVTVAQLLADANTALGGGGLPGYVSNLADLNDLVTALNESFDNCMVGSFAQAHLCP